jgi:hypothetical protein
MSAARRQTVLKTLFPALLVGAGYVALFHRQHVVDETAAREALAAARKTAPTGMDQVTAAVQVLEAEERVQALRAKREELLPTNEKPGDRPTAGWLARLLEENGLTLRVQSATPVRPPPAPAADGLPPPASPAVTAANVLSLLVTVEFDGGYLDVVRLLDRIRVAPGRAVPQRLEMRRSKEGGPRHLWTLTVAM